MRHYNYYHLTHNAMRTSLKSNDDFYFQSQSTFERIVSSELQNLSLQSLTLDSEKAHALQIIVIVFFSKIWQHLHPSCFHPSKTTATASLRLALAWVELFEDGGIVILLVCQHDLRHNLKSLPTREWNWGTQSHRRTAIVRWRAATTLRLSFLIHRVLGGYPSWLDQLPNISVRSWPVQDGYPPKDLCVRKNSSPIV